MSLYSRSQKVGTSLPSCPLGKVEGIPALFILNLCSNFLGFTIGRVKLRGFLAQGLGFRLEEFSAAQLLQRILPLPTVRAQFQQGSLLALVVPFGVHI